MSKTSKCNEAESVVNVSGRQEARGRKFPGSGGVPEEGMDSGHGQPVGRPKSRPGSCPRRRFLL